MFEIFLIELLKRWPLLLSSVRCHYLCCHMGSLVPSAAAARLTSSERDQEPCPGANSPRALGKCRHPHSTDKKLSSERRSLAQGRTASEGQSGLEARFQQTLVFTAKLSYCPPSFPLSFSVFPSSPSSSVPPHWDKYPSWSWSFVSQSLPSPRGWERVVFDSFILTLTFPLVPCTLTSRPKETSLKNKQTKKPWRTVSTPCNFPAARDPDS